MRVKPTDMLFRKSHIITLFILLFVCSVNAQPNRNFRPGLKFKASVAKVDITPALPMWLTGYASRDNPASGVEHALWAKALVIEDGLASRVVIVTVDILGLSKEILEDVTVLAIKKYKLQRSQLLFNSSHTHTGPMIWPCLEVIYDFNTADLKRVSEYNHQLTGLLLSVIDKAMASLEPVNIFSGHGTADFAANRRNSIHPNGPVDTDIPVVKVIKPDGSLMAILFGYACHNTTILDGYEKISGDYSGYAQLEIEKQFPGATALFMMGCAGDQDPGVRGDAKQAEKHGIALASSVKKVIDQEMTPVKAPIRTQFNRITLEFTPANVQQYQKDIIGDNKFLQRRAKLMLEAYNRGWPVDKLSYPIQVLRFNTDLTILGLGDEVVVDYSLKFKKAFKGENLYVAGYCNEVQCYIPSKRILGEGGYEANESMIYYGFPGPFKDDVEDRITTEVYQLMKKVGVSNAGVKSKK